MSSTNPSKKINLSKDDENKSFVGQMASTMTRLLPNRITQWFSATSNANGSTQMAESTDSSTEDESTDGPLQPPAKRMRYNIPGPSSLYTIPETRSISTNTEPTESSDHLENRSIYNLNLTSKPCEEPSVVQNEIEKSVYILHDSLPTSRQKTSRKRKSLDIGSSLNQLNESYEREFGVLNEHKPFFRIGLAASSPFYRGNTKYGGTNNAYVNQANIKSQKTTCINKSMNNNEAAMSNSAKRIMDLLDNFSSPTIEARRIPQITNTSINSDYSMNISAAGKKKLVSKNTELYIPSMASVLKLKERSRLIKTTSVARRIIASQSSSSDICPVGSPKSDRATTSKIRSRVTKNNQKDLEMEQTVTCVNLPTATLQIDKDNLPKFSFHISLPESAKRPHHETGVSASITSEPKRNTVHSSDPEVVSIEKPINKIATDAQDSMESNTFKFSSPVRICVETAEDPSSPQNFALCSPDRNVEDKPQPKASIIEKNNQNTKSHKVNLEKEQEKACNIKKCTECEAELNKEQAVICSDCEKAKQPKPSPIVVTSTKWRCGDCWVDNDEGKDNCVCCGGKKPSKSKSTDVSQGDKKKDDLKSKTPSENNINKPKDALLSNVAATNKPNSTLSHIVKQQSSKWECSNCMVRNDNNTSKCVCCETEKPGTVREDQSKSFNFGISPNKSIFKFGIDPKQNISTKENTKSIESMESQDKPPEKNNNVFFGSKIEFKSAEIKSIEIAIKPTETIKETSDTPKFSFGIPKDNPGNTFTPISSPATFSFGLPKPSEKSKTEQNDKTNTTPEMGLFGIKPLSNDLSPITNTTLPLLNKPLTMTQTNTSTTAESVAPQKTFSFSSSNFTPTIGLFNTTKSTTSTETTATLSNPIISTAAPTLSFFSKNTTSGASTQPIFFKKNEPETSATLPLFPKPESTTSLFPKPEPTTTTSLSLFSKSESTTKEATQPLVSGLPVFSFGSNVPQNAQQPAEKPKFTFTFGPNKSDSPALFNAPPPFGSTADKFQLSYPNLIGSGLSGNNGISNNTMNTPTLNVNTLNNNALGNNTVSTNIMGSNALVNNAMTSNPISGNIMENNAIGNNAMSSNSIGNNAISNNILTNNILGNNTMNNNGLSNSNSLTAGNPLAGLACGNGLSAGTSIGGDTLSNALNSTSAANPIGGNIFNTAQKKDMWSTSNSSGSNIFATNTATSTVQKPAAFAFCGSTSFNTSNATSTTAFGSPPPQPPQGTQAAQAVQPTSNIFGNTSSNPPPLFPNAVPNQPTQSNVFGAAQPSVAPMGLFGPTGFGAPNTFENAAMSPAQTPAFNFGASNNQPSMFAFTQRPQMQQSSSVYNFGAPGSSSTPQVQFNMGSAPVAGRRVRKVIRRTTAR